MSDPTLYLYTSLTAGSSHIVTATARLETILKANKLPFKAIDVATDATARKLWGRRSRGKKLPGLVKFGSVVGDLEQVEEWNEYGELRMQINNVEDLDGSAFTAVPLSDTNTAASAGAAVEDQQPERPKIQIQNPPVKEKETEVENSITIAMRRVGEEAASKAKNNGDENKQPESKPDSAADEAHDKGATLEDSSRTQRE